MQKLRRNSQEAMVLLWDKVLVPPQGISITISWSSSAGTWVPTHVHVSGSVLSDAVTPWTVPCQAPPSMGFPRPEYWSEFPVPSPEDLPDSGIEPRSSTLQVDFYHLTHQESPPTQVEDGKFWLSTRFLEHCPVTQPPTNQKTVCTQWKIGRLK